MPNQPVTYQTFKVQWAASRPVRYTPIRRTPQERAAEAEALYQLLRVVNDDAKREAEVFLAKGDYLA